MHALLKFSSPTVNGDVILSDVKTCFTRHSTSRRRLADGVSFGKSNGHRGPIQEKFSKPFFPRNIEMRSRASYCRRRRLMENAEVFKECWRSRRVCSRSAGGVEGFVQGVLEESKGLFKECWMSRRISSRSAGGVEGFVQELL